MAPACRLLFCGAAALLLLGSPLRAAQDPPDDQEEMPSEQTEGMAAEDEEEPQAHAGSLKELDELLGLGEDDAKGVADLPEETARLRGLTQLYGGAELDPEYVEFLQDAGRREVREWPALFGGGRGKGAGDPAWVNLGPTRADYGQGVKASDSGQAQSIAVHPTDAKTLWVATGGGGLWKTTDGGASWSPKTDALGSLSTGAVTVDPRDPQKVYLGLGEPHYAFFSTGIGVVRSTDGGETWGEPVAVGDARRTRALLVVGGAVLAAMDTGVFRSTDEGKTWTNVLPAPHLTGRYGGAWALASGGNGKVLASTQPKKQGVLAAAIWTSQDGGATWKEAAVPGGPYARIGLSVCAGSPQTAYALATRVKAPAEVLRSEDGGATWKALGVAGARAAAGRKPVAELLTGQESYNVMVAAHPKDPDLAFVGMTPAVVRVQRTDGGWTFTQLSDWMARGFPYVHADMHAGLFDPTGALLVATDGGIFKSSDEGATWTDTLNVGIVSHRFYTVSASPADPDYAVGGLQDAGSRARVGNTSTFNLVGYGDGFGSVAHPRRKGHALTSSQNGQIYHVVNGEVSLSREGVEDAPFITPLVAWAGSTTGDDVYTATNAQVLRSSDFGQTWSELPRAGLPGAPLTNVAVAPASDQNLAVIVERSAVYVTSDGGKSWTAAARLPEAEWVMDLNFAKDPKTLYLASSKPDARAAHLWRSTDLGATWQALDGAEGFPAGVAVNSITVDPRDDKVLYAGTHLGLYRSTDGGAKWARYGVGLPLVSVMDVYVAPDGSLLRVGTFGRGIWELRPDGSAAQEAPEPAFDEETKGDEPDEGEPLEDDAEPPPQ